MVIEERYAQAIAHMCEQELFDSEITMSAQVLKQLTHFIVIEPPHLDPPDEQAPASPEALVFRGILRGSCKQIRCSGHLSSSPGLAWASVGQVLS